MPQTTPPDSLARYLAEIRRHPLLSRAEEVRLARLAASGDEAAKRRLVECNLRLVVVIARRYRGLGLDLPDLVQEGNLGLVAAAERYDGRREASFATYASWWIRRDICRALSARSRVVRLPTRLAESATRVHRAEDELAQRLGRRASCEEVARAADVDEETVAQLRRAALTPVSLSEPVADGETPLEETLSDGGEADPARVVAARHDTAGAMSALSALGARARRIVHLRYGLGGGRPRTLVEVADELGVSPQRVRQLELRALRDLSVHPRLRALRPAA